jgi:hypothetical protein
MAKTRIAQEIDVIERNSSKVEKIQNDIEKICEDFIKSLNNAISAYNYSLRLHQKYYASIVTKKETEAESMSRLKEEVSAVVSSLNPMKKSLMELVNAKDISTQAGAFSKLMRAFKEFRFASHGKATFNTVATRSRKIIWTLRAFDIEASSYIHKLLGALTLDAELVRTLEAEMVEAFGNIPLDASSVHKF